MKFEEAKRYKFRPKHKEETKRKISKSMGGKNSRTSWHRESVEVIEHNRGVYNVR